MYTLNITHLFAPNVISILAGKAVFYVAVYLMEERRRWAQMGKPYQSPGRMTKIFLLYCHGRGLNSRPSATIASNMVKVSNDLSQSATEEPREGQLSKPRLS